MLSLERDVNTLAGRTGLLAGGQPLLSPTCGSYGPWKLLLKLLYIIITIYAPVIYTAP
jgi:hypothetical protein